MNISDETLSAFLDGELSAPDMEQVRAQLAEDPALADRLAELSEVDELVSQHAHSIDQRPLPKGLEELLKSSDSRDSAPQSAQIVQFPVWRRASQVLNRYTGIAAAVALALGFGLGQMTDDAVSSQDTWQPIAERLETVPSGTREALPDGRELEPRITFVNRDGEYCRQYTVTGAEERTENIACRAQQADSSWEQVASIKQRTAQPGSYQTASGGSVLDSTLDEMMADGVIEPRHEKQLIEREWQQH